MATKTILSLDHNLDYTFPDEIIHEDMRHIFSEVVGLCGVTKRILITKYPSTKNGFLQPVFYDDIVKAYSEMPDKSFLEMKRMQALAEKHWFFNRFIIPVWYDGDELSDLHLPNIKLSWTEGIEEIVIYQNDPKNPQ